MIPTSSSASTNGCDNISSNCVVWQGPDIACIDLCTGDTITDVTAKLATKVCDIITNGVDANPNLSGLDLTCLNIQGQTPTTLVPVLQEMVNQICANSSGTTVGTSSNLARSKQTTDSLPIMTLPACMQYDDKNGNPVTELRLDLFASLIANQVCTNLQSIQIINTTLSSYGDRLNTLEACVLPCSGVVAEKQVIPTCIINVGNLTDVSVLLLALEQRFCALENAVGTPTQINSAISQTSLIGSTSSLSSEATYGSITGYNNNPSTLAQSVQNAWIVIDDLYNAVSSIQTNCCPTGCDSVVFAYTTSNVLNAAGSIDAINFDFTSSSIPSSFTTPAGSSVITLTDSLGSSATAVVDVTQLQSNGGGYNFPIPTLNQYGNISVSIDFKVTDSTSTCESVESSVIDGVIPCPTILFTDMTVSGGNANFTNLLGVTAQYTLTIREASSNNVVGTYVINNPGSQVTQPIGGLTAATTYTAELQIIINGQTKECDRVDFNTASASAPCDAGMDVAFIIDYTGSMGDEIDFIKTGMSGIINTIDTSSGSNNYRIGIITVDEMPGSDAPNYGACADYTSLPATQKIANTGIGVTQYLTAWEMFSDNNGTTANTQVQKLNGGVDGVCVQLGDGNYSPEPTDMAIGQVLTGNFLNAFRANVAKYIVVITDALPGGDDDAFTPTDYTYIGQLTNQANNQGVKIIVLGDGVDATFDNGGTIVYPWRELAINTGGSWNANEDPSTINAELIASC